MIASLVYVLLSLANTSSVLVGSKFSYDYLPKDEAVAVSGNGLQTIRALPFECHLSFVCVNSNAISSTFQMKISNIEKVSKFTHYEWLAELTEQETQTIFSKPFSFTLYESQSIGDFTSSPEDNKDVLEIKTILASSLAHHIAVPTSFVPNKIANDEEDPNEIGKPVTIVGHPMRHMFFWFFLFFVIIVLYISYCNMDMDVCKDPLVFFDQALQMEPPMTADESI